MPTTLSISIARARASFFVMSLWRSAASSSCLPIVCTGFSDVIGSWKIIAISLPRISPQPLRVSREESSPRNSTCPVDGCDLRVVEAHHREARHALAAPRLADDAEHLAGLDGEADAVDGSDEAVVSLEGRPEVADVEERCHVSARPR